MAYVTLQALRLSKDDNVMTLYFDGVEAMLRAKAELAQGIPGVHIEVDDAPNRLLVRTPNAAVELAKLWFDAPAPEPTQAADAKAPKHRAGTKADRLIQMLQRPDGVTAEEVAKEFGIKLASATSRISVETRKRGLHATLTDGRYHVAS